MKRISWPNRTYDTDTFKPYLLQVLEARREGAARVTVDETREAIAKNLDPMESSGLARKVAWYIDDLVGMYYMGAAEYEFGGIPNAIQYLTKAADSTTEVVVPAAKIPRNFFRGNPYYDKEGAELEHLKGLKKLTKVKKARLAELEAKGAQARPDLKLFYVGPQEYLQFIPSLVEDMVAGRQRNKNGNHFQSLADPVTEYDRNIIGWLCIDYPFFLVKDESVFKSLCQLFGV